MRTYPGGFVVRVERKLWSYSALKAALDELDQRHIFILFIINK